MPDWSNDYFYYSAGTSIEANTWDICFSSTQVRQQYEEWKQECERQDSILEQMIQEDALREAELARDKKRYPLFFLKDGIV